MTMANINEAILMYVGYGTDTYPKEDRHRLIARFGSMIGSQLATEVELLLQELEAIKPDWNTQTLEVGSALAVRELSKNHPELDDRAVAALKWTFSWWWK